ncbi:MAG: hypothetical protein K2F83_07585, partial [Oscillospiraceae bacterium]|nr:hypothetical protein [Oscillospiraceae bacterium]
SMALLNNGDGFVYSWGSNSKGQLGTGYNVSEENHNLMRNYPSQVIYSTTALMPNQRYLTNTTMIAAGGYHSLAVGTYSIDGETSSTATSMLGWGWNLYGQLGQPLTGNTDYNILPDFTVINNEATPPKISGVRKIAAGERHTIVLTGTAYTGVNGVNTNRIRIMGDNSDGRLGNIAPYDMATVSFATDLLDAPSEDGGQSISDGLDVAAGRYFSVIVRGKQNAPDEETGKEGAITESKVYAFGLNTNGQLGREPGNTGSVYMNPLEITVDGMEGHAAKVTASGAFVGLLTDNNEVYTWGENAKGQLGDFTLLDRSVPTKVGFEEAWLPQAAGVITYGGALEYDVVVRVEKDHVVYPENGREYKLVLNNPVATTVDLVADMVDDEPTGYYRTAADAKAKGGSYSIWASIPGSDADGGELLWEDTLADVEVGKGHDFEANPAIVDFFTINFDLSEQDSDGSEIKAIYDGKPVQSGDVVWGNGKLVITVIGKGGLVDNYEYTWANNAATGSNVVVTTTQHREGDLDAVVDGILTVESLTDTFDMTCAITGPTGHGVSVKIRKDNADWSGSGKEIRLVSAFKPDGYVLTDNGSGTFSATDIASGRYFIVDNGYNTGRVLDVGGTGVASETLDYHTLNYSVTPSNGLIWAYINAYYVDMDGKVFDLLTITNDQNYSGEQKQLADTLRIPSGTPVLQGAKIVMRTKAQAFGSMVTSNNRFSWGDKNNTMSPVETYVLDSEFGIATFVMGMAVANVSCEASNQFRADAGVDILRVTLDGNTWSDAGDHLNVSLESSRDRSSNEAINNGAVWASYPISHTANGVFHGSVPADANYDYYICVNGSPLPGITVRVNGSSTNMTTVSYYTFSYKLSTSGTASAGTLTVETVSKDGSTRPMLHTVATVTPASSPVTGTTYIPYVGGPLTPWKGDLKVTVEGKGANTYTYTWIFDGPPKPVNGAGSAVVSTNSALSTNSAFTFTYGQPINLELNIAGNGTPASASSFNFMGMGMEPGAFDDPSELGFAGFPQISNTNTNVNANQQTAQPVAEAANRVESREGGEIIAVTLIVGRDLGPWPWNEENPVTQKQLLLGTVVELLPGDTLDITGTVERYQSGFRLSKDERTSHAYLNTANGSDSEGQPYIVMPEKDGEGDTLDQDGLIVEESEFILASSNPNIVKVEGYTLTAVGDFGEAVIRVYNTKTKRSAMLTVKVVHSEDYQLDPTQSIYRSTPMVAAGDGFSIALKADGSVWSWGDNSKGQLGTGDTLVEYSDSPVKVLNENGLAIRNIIAISAGADHALAVDRDGNVYAWGNNATGQLGRKPVAESESDKANEDYWSSIFYAVKLIDMDGDPADLPFREGIQVIDAAAGNGFSLLLTNEGTVFGVGRNDKGQLGVGYTNDVVGYDATRDRFLFNIQLNGDATILGVGANVYASPYYIDNYFEYAQYLLDVDDRMSKFRQVEQTEDPLHAFESIKEYFDPDTYEAIIFVPTLISAEMPDYDTYVAALKLYNTILARIGDQKPILRINMRDNVKDPYVHDDNWELVRPAYTGATWTYESYEEALEGYLARLEDGNLKTDMSGINVIEGEPTFNNYTYRLTQVLEGQSASRGYYMKDMVKLSAGDGHVVALRSDGSVYAWGDNRYGQLGVDMDYVLERSQDNAPVGGTFTYRVPIRVVAGGYTTGEKAEEFTTYQNHQPLTYMNNVVGITAGGNHTMLLLADGTVWSFGEDTYGQLGTGRTNSNPESGYRNTDWAYDTEDEQLTTPIDPITVPELIANMTSESRVPAAQKISFSSSVSRVVNISAGSDASLALALNGDVYAWGSNVYGQIGQLEGEKGETVRLAFTTAPKAVNKGESANVDSNNPNFSDAINISAGYHHMAAVKSNGYVWNWGDNQFGQMGNGKTDTAYVPVQAGDGDSKALLLDKYWVYNADGTPTTKDPYQQTRPMGEMNPAQLVMSEGQYMSFDLADLLYSYRTGFNLLSDGENTHITDYDDVDVGTVDPSVLTIHRGAQNGDSVKVTVHGNDKLGFGTVYIDYNFAGNKDDENSRPDSNMMALPIWIRHVQKYEGASDDDDGARIPDRISAAPMVAAGENHSLALDSMGQIWVWGDNHYGQLGLDLKYETVLAPEPILSNETFNGQKVTFTAIAAGKNFSLAVDNFGRVWSWGDNSKDQLGRGNATQVEPEVPMVVQTVDKMGRAAVLGRVSVTTEYYVERPDGSQEHYTDTYLDRIIAVSAGENHAMALSISGYVYTWGDNTYGQLGQNNRKLATSKFAKRMTKGASPSTSTGVEEVITISAGGNTSAAHILNGTLFMVGRNAVGALGDNTTIDRYALVKVIRGESFNEFDEKNAYLDKVVSVAQGSDHVVALRLDGSIYVWGEGAQGQIGFVPESPKITVYICATCGQEYTEGDEALTFTNNGGSTTVTLKCTNKDCADFDKSVAVTATEKDGPTYVSAPKHLTGADDEKIGTGIRLKDLNKNETEETETEVEETKIVKT